MTVVEGSVEEGDEQVAAGEAGGDPPAAVHQRALALTEYLLAVRALLDKPVRTVPTTDAYWQHDLPESEECALGPRQPGGSWLRVGRPEPPTPPSIPTGLLRHLAWDLSATAPPTLGDDAPEDTRAEFTSWHEQEWAPWSRAHQRAEAARRLHDRLYDLRYRVDIDAARVELVWGHAVLRHAGVEYPLLATPVAIEYDPDAAAVTVVPQGPARLQADALADVDERRVADLLDLGGPGGQVDVDPWDPSERHDFARRALRRLGLDATVWAGLGEPPEGGHVYDTGVLFVRPRQRMVRRFLERLRDRLASEPDAAVGALAAVLAHEPSKLRMPDDDPADWTRVGERLLMPMATNDAQESIARRLAAHRAVAVQGPPGTGKTHTIRNLICHLVAHGKRVLVLAQKEDPLRVLRDGLPADIQPLCLAVLGRSADQLVQLQVAARELSDRAATLDQEAEAAWVRRLVADIEAGQAVFAQARSLLLDAAEREAATYEGRGAGEVGEWLRRHEADNLVPDAVPPGTPPPLDAAEFTALADLARRIPAADRAAALAALPEDGVLPTGEDIATAADALRDARKVVDALRDRGLSIEGVRRLGATALDELAAALRGAVDELTRREGSWTDRLGQLIRDPSWRVVWDDHVAACQQLLTELGRRTAFVAGRRVTVPEPHAAQPRKLLTQLSEVRARYAAGKPIRRLTHAELARLVADVHVDGEPLRTTDDVDLVVASVQRDQLRQQLAARWGEWRTRLDAPVPDTGPEPELWAGRLLSVAVEALDWESRRWPELRTTLAVAHPRCPPDADARRLAELAGEVEAAGNVFVLDRLIAEHTEMTGWLRAHAAESPIHQSLAVAWERNDLVAWDAALAETRRLWTLRPDTTRYAALHAQLATVAPQWAATIDSGAVPADGAAALRAWSWRQAQTWFDGVVGDVDGADLGRRLERARDQIRRLTSDLVVSSAWLEVSLTLDDRRKAALADWTAALRKIGKGTGKSAAHWQAAAQRAMSEAVTAVPVWIMSIDRALEQFAPHAASRNGDGQALDSQPPIFDVVIVDEASQADVFALPVLSLARRAVVVGDDQQIGPQLVGIPGERVNALINTHLTPAGVPSAEHFDTESSLYDHAVRRSPQRILLTEHFRSVPTIIGFSSAAYYDGKIQPLRASRSGLDASVVSVHVPDGRRETLPEYGEVNVAEAEALVKRVASIVADPSYTGRSLGVVSLLSGSGQAAYLLHRLREEIGPDELERRELRVGDPYTFQGDERDIVLVSMVVASADGAIGAFTKRDFHRRVNVAASRARDQMWVFHSVTLTDLHADDARAALLAYAQRPPAAQPVAGEPVTEFQRAVLRRLTEGGLRPVPQYRVGTFTVDFVVAAPDGRRLAIECDGDSYHGAEAFAHELRRQAILERVGNCVFVRLRASTFHRDPDAALRPVWTRADELGIVTTPPTPLPPSAPPAPPAASAPPAPLPADQGQTHVV
ncbi:AAA domain-containing protein [Micromonospora sp. CPCC 206061]|uniref:AAA domain-containing protein n=1 Tax=Micromonospora sp. CPCC 206061 TaxID=3122410 RepID=UPI002FEF9F5F